MICNKCGAEYPDTEVKCPQCEAEPAKAEEVLEVADEVIEEVAEATPVYETAKKSKKGLWIITAAVLILAAAAAVFGVSSNLYYTSANDENASVYVITKKEMDRVYAKVGTKEAYLVKELGENEVFSENSEFVVKNNNLYFLNDDGGLSIMNMKNGKTKEIGIDFKAGTLVLSAKGDTVLFVGEDGCLYKSTKGRQAKKVADIGEVKFENTLPNYGFVEGTNKAWYSPLDAKASMTSVYLESGECIAEDVASVFYVGEEGKTVVYTTVTDEEVVEQEPVEPAEGEEAVTPEPIVIKSYALMVKEEGKDAAVLNEKYEQTDSVSILHKDRKGVIYLADKGETPTDPETGEVTGTAVGTLYFHEFGGETIALETEVSVALVLEELSGSNYWYDASDRAEDETIAFMKSNTISLIRDMKVVKNPPEFEFLSSNPMFANNNTFMIYKTYNPAPATETKEEEEAEATEETEAQETAPVKLVYSKIVDDAWSEYTFVAENVIDYSYDEDSEKIYYLLDENNDTENLVLYCHNVKTQETVKIAEDVLGYMTFKDKGKSFYYVGGFDSETQTASFSLYNGKESKVVAEGLSGCMITSSGTPYIVIPNGEDTDLYYIDGDKAELVCKKMTNILYGR